MSDTSSRVPLSLLRHELRTPINQILGYAELMTEEMPASSAPSTFADLQRIRSAAKTLLNLINDNLTDDRLTLLGGIVDRGSSTAAPFPFSGTSVPAEGSDPEALGLVTHSAADVSAQLIHAGSPDEESTPTRDPGRILVADDHPANRDLLARQLTRQGHSVVAVSDGRAALDRLRAEPFDLVLLDLMMPVLDGFSTLVALKADPALRHLPVIMISALDQLASVVRCIERGADDFLPKPFNPVLLRARIGAGLERKRLRDQESGYVRTIEQTQARLRAELAEAENYVRSILPPPGRSRGIPVDWRLVPSTELGGDSFGYHWIDDDHFALYLLDVCGHGVGAALLSVAAINVLRNSALPGVDFRDPGAVLTALNEAFLMDRQNGLYFTLWYGVWRVSTRILRHASAGHPPALLVSDAAGGGATVEPLRRPGMVLGGLEGTIYSSATHAIPGPARLYVVSDGTFEIRRTDGTMWPEADFRAFFSRRLAPGESDLDALLARALELHGPGPLEDDFSIVRFDL